VFGLKASQLPISASEERYDFAILGDAVYFELG
jgi:hypothetical protein